MSRIRNLSRRGFLQGVVSTGAFVLGIRLVPEALWADAPGPADPLSGTAFHPNVFVGLEPDGTVVIVAARSEMGTGSRTSLPAIVADEMEADWSRVRVEQAIGDAKYGEQDTDGSHSVRSFFGVMRETGASARTMLVQAGAEQWNVPVSECEASLHTVIHKPSGAAPATAVSRRRRPNCPCPPKSR